MSILSKLSALFKFGKRDNAEPEFCMSMSQQAIDRMFADIKELEADPEQMAKLECFVEAERAAGRWPAIRRPLYKRVTDEELDELGRLIDGLTESKKSRLKKSKDRKAKKEAAATKTQPMTVESQESFVPIPEMLAIILKIKDSRLPLSPYRTDADFYEFFKDHGWVLAPKYKITSRHLKPESKNFENLNSLYTNTQYWMLKFLLLYPVVGLPADLICLIYNKLHARFSFLYKFELGLTEEEQKEKDHLEKYMALFGYLFHHFEHLV